jgi:general secretion pathway protein K
MTNHINATFRKSRRTTQRGAAILTAMLTVVLVATLAASAMWQQWRGVEIESAQQTRTQSSWVLTGALDWARLILREDANKGGADHLAEPWAVPLAPSRLSTFLALDRSDALAADATQEAFLAGQIIDLQSRLNLTNLIQGSQVHEPSRLAFERLFKLLNLPQNELTTLTEQLRQAQDAQAVKAKRPLWPQNVDQLTWVGLSARSIAQLRPFVALLPKPTRVNLNTAPAEVIYACVPRFELADAHRWVTIRNANPMGSLSEATQASGQSTNPFNDLQHSVNTDYFEVRGSLQIDQSTVQERSVVQRDGLDVKTLQRQRVVLNTALLQ